MPAGAAAALSPAAAVGGSVGYLKEEHAKAIAAALRNLKLSAAQMQTILEKSAEFARS